MTDYRSAGVDLAGAERHVEAIRSLVTATWGPNIVGGALPQASNSLRA